MLTTLLVSAVLAVPARAAPSCDPLLAVDRTSPDGLFVDRKRFGDADDRELVLERLVDEVAPGRPILMLDFNPNPRRWADANVVAPRSDARFPGRTYAALSAAERGRLFADFFARADRRLAGDARPVLIVDHHFPSRILADVSTTPLVVDFLTWLFAQPPTLARERLRAAFTRGVILRDHADADIVLASFATRLADRPADLARYGPLIKRTTLYADHAVMDPTANATEVNETRIAYALMAAFERHILAAGDGAFAWVLDRLPRALELVEDVALHLYPDESDPVGRFLAEVEDPQLCAVFARMRTAWATERALCARIDHMLKSGEGVRRDGDVLALDFGVVGELPVGLTAVRAVRDSDVEVASGARALVLIARTAGRAHVKMRALAADVSFDRILPDVVARQRGGGGRSGAAGLYASSGRIVAPTELAADVLWLVERLKAIPRTARARVK